jgi:hypothetical protein
MLLAGQPPYSKNRWDHIKVEVDAGLKDDSDEHI